VRRRTPHCSSPCSSSIPPSSSADRSPLLLKLTEVPLLFSDVPLSTFVSLGGQRREAKGTFLHSYSAGFTSECHFTVQRGRKATHGLGFKDLLGPVSRVKKKKKFTVLRSGFRVFELRVHGHVRPTLPLHVPLVFRRPRLRTGPLLHSSSSSLLLSSLELSDTKVVCGQVIAPILPTTPRPV